MGTLLLHVNEMFVSPKNIFETRLHIALDISLRKVT